MRYATRDREAGNTIEKFKTLEDAEKAIRQYEKDDLEDGIFTENFYEIYDCKKEKIVGGN
jgi:hypothetical protein